MGTKRYTNNAGIPLSMAVFLAVDHYDYVPGVISATSLLKPIRQYILSRRVPAGENIPDVEDLISSRMGTAIHDGVEKAWLHHYQQAMKDLGYPQRVIDRIRVNPDPKTVVEGDIPVYMEIRSFKEVNGVKVSGKFDFVGNGGLEDFKSTSTYTWLHDTKDEDYVLQGSIYRWLNPEIITSDIFTIQFLFTDWSRAMTYRDPKYPPRRMMPRKFKLMPLADTEAYVINRLNQIAKYMDAPDDEIPECTDKELWRSTPEWKYYKNPKNKTRSTKNFTNQAEAIARWTEDGGVGEVVEIPGQVKACLYCPAFPVCKQKDRLIDSGDLILDV